RFISLSVTLYARLFGHHEPCREWGYFYSYFLWAGDYVISSSHMTGYPGQNYFFFTGRRQPSL
ncbi:hypothetical protein NE699_24870, partial [Escherichia coli]|uniref:hypothetical protein n=1 Tax=Escherichia coli TaxID=562 RepID=UPI00210AB0E3